MTRRTRTPAEVEADAVVAACSRAVGAAMRAARVARYVRADVRCGNPVQWNGTCAAVMDVYAALDVAKNAAVKALLADPERRADGRR